MSCALFREYLDRFGEVLHQNTDEVQEVVDLGFDSIDELTDACIAGDFETF